MDPRVVLLLIVLLIMVHLVFPVASLVVLWRNITRSKFDRLLALFVAATLTAFSVLIGRWDWLSYYLSLLLLAAS